MDISVELLYICQTYRKKVRVKIKYLKEKCKRVKEKIDSKRGER